MEYDISEEIILSIGFPARKANRASVERYLEIIHRADDSCSGGSPGRATEESEEKLVWDDGTLDNETITGVVKAQISR
jgi:hypothetical protein